MPTQTRHSATCKMTFGRKDPTCPRCQELLQGAAPRAAHFRPRPVQSFDASVGRYYCFCGGSNLWDSRCPVCGKPPFTD